MSSLTLDMLESSTDARIAAPDERHGGASYGAPMSLPASAFELLQRHISTVTRDPAAWYALFAEDAVIEFPYAAGTALTPSLSGIAAIREHFGSVGSVFGVFTMSAPLLYATTDPDVALAEVHGSSILVKTGAPYEQDYVMVVRATAGRIVRYREYWNPLLGLLAFPEARS
jgi:ketosteroid isomerase-like protein